MRPDIKAWQKSVHSQINCEACHVKPGLVNLLVQKVRNLKEPYLFFTRTYELPINAEGHVYQDIESENCLQCHNPKNRKATPSHGIKINHLIHLKNEIHCPICHNRVAHPQEYKFDITEKQDVVYEDNLLMPHCMECHNGEKAPRECEKCHTPDFELKPMNHDKSWLSKHGKQAQDDKEPCLLCHWEKQFCINCHGMDMPHPDTWKSTHSELGKKQPADCQKCHGEQDFCNNCHHKAPDPKLTWIEQHFKVVKEKGSADCINCHEQTFCAACHVRINQ